MSGKCETRDRVKAALEPLPEGTETVVLSPLSGDAFLIPAEFFTIMQKDFKRLTVMANAGLYESNGMERLMFFILANSTVGTLKAPTKKGKKVK